MKEITSLKLSNHLVKYSALSASLVGLAQLNGQVDYTPNINETSPGWYFLDLNDDGINDFRIGGGLYYNYIVISDAASYLPDGNSFLGELFNYAYPFALNIDDLIGPTQSQWFSHHSRFGSLNYNSCNYVNSNWCGVTDKFLGLRFKIGSDTHYGWARLDVDYSAANWIIKDFAYEQTQGVGITAGAGLLGLDENIFSEIKIVALNKSVALFNLPQNTNYKLFTITGQSVLDGKTDNDTYVIDANTLSSGIYIIELKDANSKAVIRKKIVL